MTYQGVPDDWFEVANGIERDFAPRPMSERGKVSPRTAKKTDAAPLPMEWFADIRPQLNGLWLIKGMLPATGIALLYGHPGSAKTFVALDFAFHVALGWTWNNRRVRKGLVVYVGAEGTIGIRNRMAAFRLHHGFGDDFAMPLVLIPTPIDMQAPAADTPRLVAAIREATRCSFSEPCLIVIDTLSKTLGAGQENTDDMVPYVSNCQRVASEFGCCVMPVHHRPKDSINDSPRGHSSLAGGADTIIALDAGKPRRMRITKQKDGEIGADLAFNLVSVCLGDDEDGDPVTSCVLSYSDEPLQVSVKGRKLNPGQTIALAALTRALAESGEPAPADIPTDMLKSGLVSRVAPLGAWRDQAFATMLKPDSKPDSARRAFDRHCDTLQSLGIVQVWEGFAWPATV